MSTASRLVSTFFTALPALFFFLLFLVSGWLGREYWWATYLAVLIVLLFSALLFGFALPTVFQKLRLRHPWIWIFAQGSLAWALALLVLGLLNLTPLCVGQNNGDGNNDLGMCVFITALSGTVYTPVYLVILVMSALIGHWVLTSKRSETSSQKEKR
ncbi:MAG TPA: hypothetical protein VFR47_33035 [Anaerolineales bacterium]|nr:hypothetical protein [Anaerolineales bacterium]